MSMIDGTPFTITLNKSMFTNADSLSHFYTIDLSNDMVLITKGVAALSEYLKNTFKDFQIISIDRYDELYKLYIKI